MKKPKLVKSDLDKQIAKLAGKTNKKTLAIWACDCAKRVLPYFEKKYPGDKRPRLAIEAGRVWIRTGVFKMAVIRTASLASHATAREVADDAMARSVARAAGQAIATAHAKGHSVVAAIYAATAIRDRAKPTEAVKAVMKERNWQYRRLLDLKNKRQLS